jgi:hypothetical protein
MRAQSLPTALYPDPAAEDASHARAAHPGRNEFRTENDMRVGRCLLL